jgi:hypothetical protein
MENISLTVRENEGAILLLIIFIITCLVKVIDSHLDILSKFEPLPLQALLEDEQQEVQAMYPIYTHRRQG